ATRPDKEQRRATGPAEPRATSRRTASGALKVHGAGACRPRRVRDGHTRTRSSGGLGQHRLLLGRRRTERTGLRVRGTGRWLQGHGFGRRALSIFEGLTMTPLLGMPIWGRAEGQSSINVYRIDDGTLVHNFHATVPVDVATTIYTFRED